MAGIDQSTLWKFANMILNKSKAQPTTRERATFLRTDSDGTQWVRLPSSNDETPVNGRTLATAKAGDTVEWSIDNGRLSITGNSTSPSVGRDYVGQEVGVVARQVNQVKADVIETNELLATKATITELEAESARIDELEADHVSVSDFQAEQASIDNLQAATADIDTIRANSAKVQNLTAAQLEADHAKVGQLDVSQIAADHATIGNLDTTYMHANMSNSDVAWIENGTIRDGAIVSAMINDVSANKLTAGTINGSVINVTNLNADNITAGTINGQRIGQGSLSLDKLSEDVYTESEVDDIVDDLNDRIDGAIETHTGTAVPTLNNQPASSWNTTALKDEHVGDVYYVVNSQSQQNGYCYRFTKSGSTYSWQLIKDSDVTAALSRLSTAEDKITTFDSDISTLKTDTGVLKTKTQSLETSLGDKVDTTTFNELSSTVDENSATITSHSTVLSNNGLTSSTNITNTVNTVSQTATGNSSKIAQLTTTLGTNADGTTKTGDVMHRTSAIEQDVSSFKTTVSETYATQTALATTNGNVTAAQTAADNAQDTANTANNKQVAFSATSSTSATTAAKVAACTNFPALAVGATVTVRFSTANTSTGAITLNVNSTGAKTVYVSGSATSSSNQLLWGANANITFTYDGSYWRVDSEPRTWYGTGSVAAATAAKTATINEVVICKGTTVVLNMTYENTSTSATLNVTSTGAKNVYYGTTTTRPTTANGYGWSAGSTVSLTFDGQYWRIGDTTALARLTAAESTISSHTTSISQNASAIALKADSSTTYSKTDVDGLITTEVTNRNAAITTKANEITSSVSENYATKTTVDGLATRVSTAESNITQNANNIALKVSESDVTGNYVVGKINLNSTTASIAASHINLQGAVTISALASDASTALTNAAETATSYVTELTGEDGIMVHPSDDDDTGVQITSDVDIMRGGTSVINIGTNDAARIGKESGAHVTVQSDGVRVLDVIDNAVTGVVKLTGSSASGFYNRVASVEMEGKNGTALRMKSSVNDDRAIILDSGFNAKVTVKSNDSASSYGPSDAYSGHAFIDLESDGLSINGTTVDMDAEVLVALQSVPKTALPLDTTLCQAYSSEYTPYYEKRAGMVIVSGAIKPKDTVAAGGSLGGFATLPAGCRPVQKLAVLCQGSNSYIWLLEISTSGELSASRYRYGNTNGSMSTSTWLPFHVVFPAQ